MSFAAPVLVLACAALPAQAPPETTETAGPAVQVAALHTFSSPLRLAGTFVPADGRELSLWPRAYSGATVFLEVLPQGSWVETGTQVARLDTRAIDDAIDQAERELVSAELEHANAVARAEIDAQAAAAARAAAHSALERERRSLEGWQSVELELRRRQDELQARHTQHGIEDRRDELNQLEAMYRDDELVDATEEIVLKRSRRDLATALSGQELGEDRRAYTRDYELAAQTASKREALARQEGELERLERGQELDARSRADALERSRAGLERKRRQLEDLRADREAMSLRAPCSGVLLHGGLRAQGSGEGRPDHRRGANAPARTPLFCIADPERLALVVDVPEARLADVRPGAGTRVLPRGGGRELVGTLRVDDYPRPGGGTEATFEGRVELQGSAAGLVAGMRAEVEVATDDLRDVIVLPRGAVFGDGDEAHCWAAPAQGGSFERTSVELGPESEGEVVVRAGLEAGQRVLVTEPAR